MPGLLYVVATPIGNLEDITFRALRTLGEVDVIAAEHLDGARPLLAHFEIDTPVIPYHDRGRDAQQLVQRMLSGETVALICDAGTPSVSDPGRRLVRAAMDAGVRVSPIPGPASSIALWSVSGSELASVWLRGFLPRRAGARRTALSEIAALHHPTLCFESPHRLSNTLTEIARIMPEAELVVGRELTKLHEQIWRGRPADAIVEFAQPRGEFTLLICPKSPAAKLWTDAEIEAALAAQAELGASRPVAARAVAQASGRPRRDVYRLWPAEQSANTDHDYPDPNSANAEESCGD